MADQQKTKQPSTTAAGGARNQGEGDRDAARRYNAEQQAFVESGQVDAAARAAGEQDPGEGAAAEQAGRARAKEFDHAEARDDRQAHVPSEGGKR